MTTPRPGRSRRLRAGPLAALLLAGMGSGASAQGLASHDPSQVRSGHYVVEPQHTQVEFGVMHLGFTTYFGRLSGASGTLELSADDPRADSLEVSVPTASVSTTSATLDGELKGAGWLDARRFPAITFRSTRIEPQEPGAALVSGELTLHGVTRPVVLQARFVGAGVNALDGRYTVGFSAGGEIRRSEFGVSRDVPLVGDAVQLTLSGAFERRD